MVEVSAAAVVPEVEVAEKAARRQFNAEYKRKILKEADACTREGEIGALLRRQRLAIRPPSPLVPTTLQ